MTCRWSHKWHRLFSGGRQGMLTVWDVGGWNPDARWSPLVELNTFEAHSEAITELLFHPLDGSIITCSLDSSIRIREPKAGTVIQSFIGCVPETRGTAYWDLVYEARAAPHAGFILSAFLLGFGSGPG